MKKRKFNPEHPNYKHGKTFDKTHNAWAHMIQRCDNPKNPSYKHYGHKGIGYDKTWRFFANFYKDMGDPPTEQHSLDRINPNENYSLQNCRWATIDEQNRNKTSLIYIYLNDQKMCLAEACRILKLDYFRVHQRMTRQGVTFEMAISSRRLPPIAKITKQEFESIKSQVGSRNVNTLAKQFGVSWNLVNDIKNGKSWERYKEYI